MTRASFQSGGRNAASLAMKATVSMNVPPSAAFARVGQQFARRVVITAVVVLLTHVALFVIMLNVGEKPVERPLASRTITAELISAAHQPVATPAVLQSAPPEPVPPKPHPVVHHTPVPELAPAPMKLSDAPSQYAPPAPADPTPAAEASPATAAAPSAPAIGRETLAINAPKDVPHLDCNIAKPDYPYLSKRQEESGTVVVRFVVGPTGHIGDIQLQKSSGHPRLDSAALDAMHDSACRPYLENGKPIQATYSQPFAFSLAD